MESNESEIIIYQPDETLKLDVQVEADTVWLTQAQMVELFQTTKQNISLHTNNIFKEGELDANSVVKEYLTTASDGKKYRTKYYNRKFYEVDTKVLNQVVKRNIQGPYRILCFN